MLHGLLLASAAWAFQPDPAAAQPGQPEETGAAALAEEPVSTVDEEEVDQEITVTGLRERGAVIGDIPPENQLDARDIRATGAASVTELLQNIAAQTGSARGRGGGPPVVLLNGRRTSGFQELRDLPPEAIFRVDILPEEVALKYGYRADQRVVNIVLRPRFRSTAARVEAGTSTDGGRGQGELDVTRLMIGENGRVSLNAHTERSGRLLESQRDILLQPATIGGLAIDPRSFRTLVPERTQLRVGGTLNRSIFDDVSATVDLRLERVTGERLFGPDATGLEALVRDTRTDNGRLGFALNGTISRWRWSADGAFEVVRSVTRSDRNLSPIDLRDSGRSLNEFGNVALVLNGPLVELPAGRSNLTLRLSGDMRDLDSRSTIGGVEEAPVELSRDRVGAAANADVPLTRRNGPLSALGNLTLNADAEVEYLSDFSTLWTYGGGFSWSPAERLNLIGSWTREEGAPGLEQLGDPLLETPGTRLFDFVRGTTALVTVRTGGNPDLVADRRTVWKLGGTWRPLGDTDLDLRVDYTMSRLRDPVSSFPGPTATIQQAFPDRFLRDGTGNLLFADLRPVNFNRAERETLRYGFNWLKSLASRGPTAAQIDRFRRDAGLPDRPAGAPGGSTTGTAPEAPRQPGGGPRTQGGGRGPGSGFGGGRGGFGFRGGPFGGGQGGRLSLSLYHNVNLKDEVLIRPRVPVIDYLSGEAVDGGGGRPRHTVELEGGWYNNGLGARVSANWRSATEVNGGPGEILRFSPLASTDLRLFANLGEQFGLVARYPWLRGTQLRLEIDNLFNSRPRVRDSAGGTPINFQPDLIDPTGRSVVVTLRKLFLPTRFQRRAGAQQGGRSD